MSTPKHPDHALFERYLKHCYYRVLCAMPFRPASRIGIWLLWRTTTNAVKKFATTRNRRLQRRWEAMNRPPTTYNCRCIVDVRDEVSRELGIPADKMNGLKLD